MADTHPSTTVGDWKSVWDERKNKYYYYHRKTRVAQWVEPKEFKMDTTTTSAPAEPSPSSRSGSSLSNQRSSSVPRATGVASTKPAWKAATDPRGRVYYYNRATNETTWKKPEGFDGSYTEQPGLSAQVEIEVASKEQAPPLAVLSPTPSIAPVLAVEVEGSSEQPSAKSGGGQSESQSSTAESRAVWKETTDKKSGKKYYYNKSTKETRWSPPPGWNDVIPVVPETTFSPSSSSAPAPVPNLTAAPAPVAKAPVAVQASPEPAALSHVEKSNNVKPIWKQTIDPKSGRPYWYNRETRETRWKKPDDSDVSAPNSKRSESAPPRSESPSSSVATSVPTLAATSPVTTSTVGMPALADWREVVDANSGRRYFYNKRSKVTQWKPPAGWVEQRALTSTAPSTPATTHEFGNTSADAGFGHAAVRTSVEPVHTPGFAALPILPAPPAKAHNFAAPSSVIQSTAAPQRLDSPSNIVAGISLASLIHVPVVTVDGTVSEAANGASVLTSSNTAQGVRGLVSSTASTVTSPVESRAASVQPMSDVGGAQTPLPLPPLPQPVTVSMQQFSFSSALSPAVPIIEAADTLPPSIPMVAAPPVSKRPDLHNLMLSHQLEVASDIQHAMGATSASSQYSGDEQTIIQGILPLNIPGAGLTPRSAALQLSGYLWKKSRTGWKGWLKRFFVTHRWLLLYYARDSDTADAPLAVVDLRFASDFRLGHEVNHGRPDSQRLQVPKRAIVDEHEEMRHSRRQSWTGGVDPACLLEIEGPDVGTYTLRAADREQAVYWYQGLLAIVHRYGCVAREASVLGQRVARRFGSYQPFQDPDMLAVDAEGRRPTSSDNDYTQGTYLAAAYPSGSYSKTAPDLRNAHHISEWSPGDESDVSIQRSASVSPRKVQRGHGLRDQDGSVPSKRHIKRSVSQSAAIKWLSKKVKGLPSHNQSMNSDRKPTRVSLNAMRDPYRDLPDSNDVQGSSVVSSSRYSIRSRGTDEHITDSVPRQRRVSFDSMVTPSADRDTLRSAPTSASITAAEFAGNQAASPAAVVVAPSPGQAVQLEPSTASTSVNSPSDLSSHLASVSVASVSEPRNDALHSLSAKAESIARGKFMSAMLSSQLEEAQARQAPATFQIPHSSHPAVTPPNPWKTMYSMHEERSPRDTTADGTPSKTIDLSSFLPMLLSGAQKDSPITRALIAARSPEQGASYPAQPVRTAPGFVRSPASAPFRLLSLHQHLATLQHAMSIRSTLYKGDENPENGAQLLLPPTTTSVVRLRTSAGRKLERCHQLLVDSLNRSVDAVGTSSLPEFQAFGAPDLENALSVVIAALRGSPQLCLSLALQLYDDEQLEQFARILSFHVLNQTSTGCASFVALLHAAADAARAAVSRSPGAHAAALVFLNDLIRTIPLWSYVGMCGNGPDGLSVCSSWQNVQQMAQAAVSSLSASPDASVRDVAVASLSAFLSAAQAGQFPFDLALAIHAISSAAGSAGAREAILQGLLAPSLVMVGAESKQQFPSINHFQTALHSEEIMNDQDVEAYISMLTAACDVLGAQIAASAAGFSWSNKISDAAVAAAVQDLQERGCFERPSELCQFCILSFDDVDLLAQCLESMMLRSPTRWSSLSPEFIGAARRIVADKDTFSLRGDHAYNRLLRMTTLPSADFVRTTLIPGEFDAMRMMLLKFNALLGETSLLEAESRGKISATVAIASVPALLEQDLVRAAQHLSASEPTLRVAFEEEQLWKESMASFEAVCHHLRALPRGVLPMLSKMSQSSQSTPASSAKKASEQPAKLSPAFAPMPPQDSPAQHVKQGASPTQVLTSSSERSAYESSSAAQSATLLSSPPASRFAMHPPAFPSLVPTGSMRGTTSSAQQAVPQRGQHAGNVLKPAGSLASLISGAFSPAAALRKPATVSAS
jgi:hypothetical protein